MKTREIDRTLNPKPGLNPSTMPEGNFQEDKAFLKALSSQQYGNMSPFKTDL